MPKALIHPEFIKDPLAGPIDYGRDVSKSLQDEETITDVDWSIDINPDPAALTTLIISTAKAPYVDGGIMAVFVEKGTMEQLYLMRADFTTSLGRKDARSFWLRIAKK